MSTSRPSPQLQPIPLRTRLITYAVALLVLVAFGFGAWGAWVTWRVQAAGIPSASQWRASQARLVELEQRVATLSRSDQISREANQDLQNGLAERDEEIAGLRTDVAFYERFVGSTAQRHGLNVHELRLQPQAGNAWHFTATLTQNVNRGAVNRGTLQLGVEGTRNGRLETLDWSALRQQAKAGGVEYSFKYFQQVEGDLFLPAGFQPVRVVVRLASPGGAAVERGFTWSEATTPGGASQA
ncbi:MAG: DUF6776 family protein [Pseudoxanthomonas sp.]